MQKYHQCWRCPKMHIDVKAERCTIPITNIMKIPDGIWVIIMWLLWNITYKTYAYCRCRFGVKLFTNLAYAVRYHNINLFDHSQKSLNLFGEMNPLINKYYNPTKFHQFHGSPNKISWKCGMQPNKYAPFPWCGQNSHCHWQHNKHHGGWGEKENEIKTFLYL